MLYFDNYCIYANRKVIKLFLGTFSIILTSYYMSEHWI